MILDLRKGLVETDQYKAWKFPGGEIHCKLKIFSNEINIITNLTSSDDLILLLMIVDSIRSSAPSCVISLNINYMAYQQADRRFDMKECFSLKIITNIINDLRLDAITIFDPHSDVAPALIDYCEVQSNYAFILDVIDKWEKKNPSKKVNEDLIILAPDAGAYKKIFKLCEDIDFKGQIECCAKSRNLETGNKTIIVPKFNETKDVLIIDDICLAGGTFLGVASQIKNKCHLAVSHGIFNNGVDHLLERFETIYTTDSRCTIENDRVKIFKL